MQEQATIIDFVGASLRVMESTGRAVLKPTEQQAADQLASTLDGELATMVRKLEEVASCQQDAPVVEGLEELPPFEAFCVGLRHIGGTLLPHLVETFVSFCNDREIPHGLFDWIVRARADAFVAYLVNLAQVHGLAFDDDLHVVGKTEQIALANLGADLRMIMQNELDKIAA